MSQGFGTAGAEGRWQQRILKRSGLILVHLYFQERLEEGSVSANAEIGKMDWASLNPLRDCASFFFSALEMIKATFSSGSG